MTVDLWALHEHTVRLPPQLDSSVPFIICLLTDAMLAAPKSEHVSELMVLIGPYHPYADDHRQHRSFKKALINM